MAGMRLRQKAAIQAVHPLAAYRNDPVAFVHDCIDWREGEGPAPYQDEILERLPIERRVSVRSPHGAGKTGLAAWAILWFALTRDGEDWKIPTTASAWRQLTKFLWPEVRKWSRRLKWNMIGREPFSERTELLSLSLKLRTGEAFALASDNSAMIEGAHAANLLFVFDEAKAIPPDTWDSAEGAFSTGEAFALSISTPGEPQGRFYDIQSRKPGYEDWWARAVTLEETIAAGRVSAEWAQARKAQWGEQSAVYINRALGNFAASDEDGVIPLSWVEAAQARWQDWHDAGGKLDERDKDGKPVPLTAIGADIARFGDDRTVFALRRGNVIIELRDYAKEDTMATTGRIAGILAAYGGLAVVDVIGIGAGVVDRLREMQKPVDAFNAAEHTDAKDRSGELGFINVRSGAWWNLRDMLEPGSIENVALPPDEKLTGDLTAPHWRVVSGGRIQIESKDDIRKRLRRSTDTGDAVVEAFWREAPAILHVVKENPFYR